MNLSSFFLRDLVIMFGGRVAVVARMGICLLALLAIARADIHLGTGTFGATGGNQIYVTPTGTSYVVIKVWGAGGGSGLTSVYHGAGGGFVTARYALGGGQTLTVKVGGGGTNAGGTWPTPSGGGWNGGGNVTDVAGAGGGASSVQTPLGLF